MQRTVVAATLLSMLVGGCASFDRPVSTTSGEQLHTLAPGWERFFDVAWQADQRNGRPIVSGSILNRYGASAVRVQLLIEGLGETGAVLAQSVAWLGLPVTPYSTAYFEVPAPGHFPAYRVSVFAFDWLQTPRGRFLRQHF